MARHFETWLKSLIEEKFPRGNREFVRAAHPPEREDAMTSYLSKVLKGERPAPLDSVGAWARALGLDGDERELFFILASLTHAPEIAEVEFLRMRNEVRSLRRDVEARRAEHAPHQPAPRKRP